MSLTRCTTAVIWEVIGGCGAAVRDCGVVTKDACCGEDEVYKNLPNEYGSLRSSQEDSSIGYGSTIVTLDINSQRETHAAFVLK